MTATTLGYVVLAGDAFGNHGRASRRRDEPAPRRTPSCLHGERDDRPHASDERAYALYDLTSYRRARHVFQGVSASDVRSDLLNIVPVGRARSFQPRVAVGEQVRRGTGDCNSGRRMIARHASVDGIVERATADGVTLRRVRMDGA